jgi:starch phosphorylase
MDGWWQEGFNWRNGWAFRREEVPGDRNQADAEAIYGILEKEFIPIYYNVSEGGVFHDWVSVMKESIKGNAARFSARRMVKEYIEKFYFKSMEGVLKD